MRQQDPILKENSITRYEFDHLFNILMTRDWLVDGKYYNLYALGWRHDYNEHKTNLGLCSPRQKMIFISDVLVELNKWDNAQKFEDTIRHEIAHAIDFEQRGTSDHSNKWKRVCVQVGADPTRLADGIQSAKGKYTIRCKSCGHESQAHRKRKRAVACSKCCDAYANGRFDPKYILEFIEN